MLDPETFVIGLYVEVDTFCKATGRERRPTRGCPPSLSVSEVVTLAIFGQCAEFRSERGFTGWAQRHLRALFPTLPHRTQFNRLQRQHRETITAFAIWLGQQLIQPHERYELLDGTGVAVRNHRRGGVGFLPEAVEICSCSRLGWFEGCRLLVCAGERGVVTGWACRDARTSERKLTGNLLEARVSPQPGLACAGRTMGAVYLADMGFSGTQCQADWAEYYGAMVLSPPQTRSKAEWPPERKRAHSRVRQPIESVFRRLLEDFRLEHERPHTLEGFLARLAAKMGLHNVLIHINRQYGQPDLTIAGVIEW